MTDKTPELLRITEPVPDFNPAADELCFCQSGKVFSECCGITRPDRPPPHGVFVFHDFVDRSLVNDLTQFADAREGERLMVIDQKASTPDNIVKVEDDRRIAERVDLGERRVQLNELIRSIYTQLAKECYRQQLEWYELPELMRYHPGGFYIRHADSHNPNPATQTWTKVIDRDLSLLVYLNEDYEGGGLTFTKFNYHLQPKAGTVVIFPSDHRYIHTAEIVTKGTRYAVVSWAAVKDFPKISQKPPECAIRVN